MITNADLVEGLFNMGIRNGEHLMVHSSLKSLGYVEDGANTVVEALLETIGSNGTLMVPTFTHSNTEYYDPTESPSKNGAITEAIRKRSDSVRSLHPTHAVTVIGPDAEELVLNDLNCGPLGKGCALDLLSKRQGRILLLGVNHEANSIIHVGEDYASDPGREKFCSPKNPKRVTLKHPDLGDVEILLTSMMGRTLAFDLMVNLLRNTKKIIDGKLGKADCQLMNGLDVIEATQDILASNKGDSTSDSSKEL